jgi:hypothetical protein
VRACYLIGSTKNATAGPCSDIDLIIHFHGDPAQRQSLLEELTRWNPILCEWNYRRTGRRCDELLDVHIVTDADVAGGSSFAVKIGAVSDGAWRLAVGAEAAASEE